MEFSRPEDQYDELTDGPELGLLLRTDYSNEDAWQAFYARLQESEQELAEAAEEEQTTLGNVYNSTSATQKAQVDEDVDVDMEAEEDGEGEEEDEPSDIFKVINPHSPRERAVFEKISNLGALRLLNDVDIQQVSSPPPGIKRISPPNRLIDQGGWQEIYTGKSVWIYDAQSNSDQCVRVVSQAGASLYGTAT